MTLARKVFAASVMMASCEIVTANLAMSKVGDGYAGGADEDPFEIVAVKPSAKVKEERLLS